MGIPQSKQEPTPKRAGRVIKQGLTAHLKRCFVYTFINTQYTTHNPRTLESEHDLRGDQREQLPRSSEKQSHFYEAEKIGGGYFWRGGTPADTGSRAGSSKLPS